MDATIVGFPVWVFFFSWTLNLASEELASIHDLYLLFFDTQKSNLEWTLVPISLIAFIILRS